jgi:hypothetical protein
VSESLNSEQSAVLAEVPTSYRTIFKKAFTTNRKTLGIKAFCLRCVGYLREDVRNCTAKGCPLWTHRPYQTGEEDEA